MGLQQRLVLELVSGSPPAQRRKSFAKMIGSGVTRRSNVNVP